MPTAAPLARAFRAVRAASATVSRQALDGSVAPKAAGHSSARTPTARAAGWPMWSRARELAPVAGAGFQLTHSTACTW